MNKFQNPVVVVGSGVSGLNFALMVSRFRPVVILTKKEAVESSTNYAQGGIAAVLDQLDSFEQHVEDTMKAGSYHNNKEAVEFMVKNGPGVIRRLIDLGVNFQSFEGKLALTREGGHKVNRVAFIGDYTGKEIESSLLENININDNIKVIEHAFALDVFKKDGKVAGIFYEHEEKIEFISTDTVVLATGGVGQLFECTTNPPISTGDGIAIGLRAGCNVRDMEFVQFHPTAFIPENGGRPFLISEAVRGEGSKLVDENGNEFVDELAPRDVVSQAIYEQMKHGKVYLDTRHNSPSEMRMRFPSIYDNLQEHGLTMGKDLIPIKPAAHYLCGGIETDFNGRTNVEGLYAFGEVTYTGVHGANRLASNSLLEALVFSEQIASNIKTNINIKNEKPEFFSNLNLKLDYGTKMKDFRKMMWENLGICRNSDGLESTVKFINKELKEIIVAPQTIETTPTNFLQAQTYLNMLQTGYEIAKAALARKDSLGCHLRVDPN